MNAVAALTLRGDGSAPVDVDVQVSVAFVVAVDAEDSFAADMFALRGDGTAPDVEGQVTRALVQAVYPVGADALRLDVHGTGRVDVQVSNAAVLAADAF